MPKEGHYFWQLQTYNCQKLIIKISMTLNKAEMKKSTN